MRVGGIFLAGFCGLIVSACAPTQVKVELFEPVSFEAGTRASPMSPDEVDQALEALSRRAIDGAVSGPLVPGLNAPVNPGELNDLGLALTDEYATALRALVKGQSRKAEALLETVAGRARADGQPTLAWQADNLRIRSMISSGRGLDAALAAKTLASFEQQIFGLSHFASVLQAEALGWAGQTDEAKRILLSVAQALAQWRLPTTYESRPSNVALLSYVTVAQLRAYTALAGVMVVDNRTEEALRWSNLAETLYSEQAYAVEHPVYREFLKYDLDSHAGRALNLTIQSTAMVMLSGQTEQGQAGYSRAEEIFLKSGYGSGSITLGLFKAYACYQIQNWACTVETTQAASALAGEAGQFDAVWRLQMMAGEAFLKLGREDKALTAFEAAQASVNAVSGSLRADRSKQTFGMNKSALASKLSALYLTRNDLTSAFVSAELGRARAFVDLLTDTELAFNDQGLTNRQVRTLDQDLLALRVQNALAAPDERPAVRELIARRLADRRVLIERMAEINPEWAAAYAPRVSSLDRIQQSLSSTQLLAYALPPRSDGEVIWLLVTRRSVKLQSLPEGATRLKVHIESLGDAIALKQVKTQEAVFAQMKADLGVGQWPKASHVFVVPDGLLHWVPWAGVSPGQSLSILPNASWLDRTPTEALRRSAGNALVVGDPDFGGDLSQLPGARSEAIKVAGLYGSEPLLGKGARKDEILRAGLNRRSVLHLATHGFFEVEEPLKSALYFSSGQGSAARVTAQELFENPLRAHTVVLSACETGLGQTLPDNDVIGLQRSFLINGAQAVVSSLWTVDDAGVAAMMTMFHEARTRQLGRSAQNANMSDESAALAQAVVRARQSGLPPSVYGAFIMTGHVPSR